MPKHPQATVQNGLSQEAYQVLAQANLLRVRGQWDEAVERCMTAMKLDPDNVSVLSLLGDIYENQGKLNDAIQWYRLALDKNPDSPADQIKLKGALNALEHAMVAQAPELLAGKSKSVPPTPRPADRVPVLNQNLLNISLRVIAYGLALAFAIIVGYGVSASMPHGARSQASGNRNYETDPVLVQSNGPSSSTFLSDARDASELSLLNALAADPQLTGFGVNACDVSDDPRSGTITVTALYTSTEPTFNSRTDILRAALRTAIETADHTDGTSATAFTVRMLATNPTTSADSLTFTGDISRISVTAITTDPATIPDGQLLAKFDNPWWDANFPG